METWIDRRLIYKGAIISVRAGRARLDNGATVRREVVDHPGGVAVVPLLGETILLVRQFRIAAGKEVLELPAGKLEPGESPTACADRELLEETGYRAGRLIGVAEYFASVGFTNERMHIFLGLDLAHVGGGGPDSDERIEPMREPVAGLEGRLLEGKFEDSKTLIGLYALLAYLRQHPLTAATTNERGT